VRSLDNKTIKNLDKSENMAVLQGKLHKISEYCQKGIQEAKTVSRMLILEMPRVNANFDSLGLR